MKNNLFGKLSLLVCILLFNQILCQQVLAQCESHQEFWCNSAKNSKCLKLNEKCFTGSALWRDYTRPVLFVNVDQNMSENVLFESENVLENMSRLRFELRKFENSTFFKRIFDIGLFKPTHEMVDGIKGKIYNSKIFKNSLNDKPLHCISKNH